LLGSTSAIENPVEMGGLRGKWTVNERCSMMFCHVWVQEGTPILYAWTPWTRLARCGLRFWDGSTAKMLPNYTIPNSNW
jgi:hypothetical protein